MRGSEIHCLTHPDRPFPRLNIPPHQQKEEAQVLAVAEQAAAVAAAISPQDRQQAGGEEGQDGARPAIGAFVPAGGPSPAGAAAGAAGGADDDMDVDDDMDIDSGDDSDGDDSVGPNTMLVESFGRAQRGNINVHAFAAAGAMAAPHFHNGGGDVHEELVQQAKGLVANGCQVRGKGETEPFRVPSGRRVSWAPPGI